MCGCQRSHVSRCYVASRACNSVQLSTDFCHGSVEGKRAVVFCREINKNTFQLHTKIFIYLFLKINAYIKFLYMKSVVNECK